MYVLLLGNTSCPLSRNIVCWGTLTGTLFAYFKLLQISFLAISVWKNSRLKFQITRYYTLAMHSHHGSYEIGPCLETNIYISNTYDNLSVYIVLNSEVPHKSANLILLMYWFSYFLSEIAHFGCGTLPSIDIIILLYMTLYIIYFVFFIIGLLWTGCDV